MNAQAETAGWGGRGAAGASIPAALGIEHVTQDFGTLRALDDVSLDIAAGEIVCLLGPSGCGKTTLLRIAAGIERPTRGRVTIDGIEVSGPSRYVPPERRGVGLMFQDYALFPHLTILDNVLFGLRKLPREAALGSARTALRRVGLERYAEAFPHTLSGGEQQRAALARAVAPRPGVLMMDEPFSNLDRRMRDEVREDTAAVLRETGATSIVVTHDPEEAMRLADRIVLMQGGRIVQVGTAEELYRSPANLFAARFFCDFNEVPGTVRAGRAETVLGFFDAPCFADGAVVTVCIRPQGIRLAPEGFCLPGRVIARRCLGEVDLVHVAVQGLEAPLQARLRQAAVRTLWREGTDVGVDVMPEEVLVFAAPDA